MTTTKVNLANTVEGILPVANGGTGSSTGVSPGGSTTQVQFNNAGAFGGSANLTFNGTTLTAAALTSTGVATFSAGTVSAPALTTTGDTNTGIFFPAADTIAFTEGGVESMRVDSSGNVGIGTSSPGVKLEVNGTGELLRLDGSTNQNRQIYFRNVGTGTARVFTDGTMTVGSNAAYPVTFITQDSERMRIDSSGNVGIGTSSPSTFSSKLAVAGNSGTGLTQLTVSGGGNSGDYGIVSVATSTTIKGRMIADATSGDLRFDTAGSVAGGIGFYTGSSYAQRFIIGAAGQLGIGASPSYGSSGQVLTSNGSGSAPSWQSPSGGVTSLNGQTGAITNTGFNNIGSYTAGVGANGGQYSVGSTIAGSSIRQNLNDQSSAFTNVQTNAGSNGNQGQSGTWRAMTRGASFSGGEGEWYLGSILWVRIS